MIVRTLLFAASVAVVAAFTVPISVVSDVGVAAVATVSVVEAMATDALRIEPTALVVLFVLAALFTVTSIVLHLRATQELPFRDWLSSRLDPLAPDRSPPG